MNTKWTGSKRARLTAVVAGLEQVKPENGTDGAVVMMTPAEVLPGLTAAPGCASRIEQPGLAQRRCNVS